MFSETLAFYILPCVMCMILLDFYKAICYLFFPLWEQHGILWNATYRKNYLFIVMSIKKKNLSIPTPHTLILNAAASQSVSWWHHIQGFLVLFTQCRWNCCIYKCRFPALWAINTSLCCISAATSAKTHCFYSEPFSVHEANLPHWSCVRPLCSKRTRGRREATDVKWLQYSAGALGYSVSTSWYSICLWPLDQ